MSDLNCVGVILPDGRIDMDGVRFVNDDVELEPIEIDQDIADAVEDGIQNPDQLVHYLKCRANGCTRNLAACFATKSFPGVKTDSIFNEGKFSGQSTGECDARGSWLRQQAEAAGVSTTGKWYCSGLASYPGDPTAWIDSRGDVLRIAREKNMTVHGYVEHEASAVEPIADVKIADDIISSEVDDIMESNPGVSREDVHEQVYALRTGAIDPNPLLVKD